MTPAPAPNSSSSSTSAPAADNRRARGSAAPAATLDCLVIGGGPAGLTAATYLARFHRRILVVDDGHSRARWIPTSHNCPGFPGGVAGSTLLQRLRAQAQDFAVPIIDGRIETLQRDGDDFIAGNGRRQWRAHYVCLASGVVDRMPAMEQLDEAIDSGAVRLCAVCDGFEASDERIAVYGPVEQAIEHALFLRTFSRSVAVVRSQDGEPDAEHAARARRAHVALLPPASALRHERGCVVEFAHGEPWRFDTLYPVLGGDAQSALALALGARCDDEGALVVDKHQQTSVDGLYAIGDIVSALNQISVAVGHAAVAACAIHNRLPNNFREDRAHQAQAGA
ncbi:NAD(P)/FAD-dependent oxidoreductase [Lysobacter koreensis]|uniref:NAD(P)/FAD-dependent oxidoreductase n=1 Tax=Lysobacter koreensis TaxID=266122 RepID=A0ABW2YMU8_9GAMM